jgi:hypothetical protein
VPAIIIVQAREHQILTLECEDEDDVKSKIDSLHTHDHLRTYNLKDLQVCVCRKHTLQVSGDMRREEEAFLASTPDA